MPHVRHILDTRKFLTTLRQEGYRSVVEFAHTTGIHRNTLNLYIKGKSVFSSSFDKITRSLHADPLDLIIPIDEDAARKSDLSEILPIAGRIVKHDPRIAVILLGSRATRAGKKHADWDIGITRPGNPIKGREYLELSKMVSDAAEDLLHDVDLINIDGAPAWFLTDIDYEPMFLGGDKDGFIHFKGVLDGAKRTHAA